MIPDLPKWPDILNDITRIETSDQFDSFTIWTQKGVQGKVWKFWRKRVGWTIEVCVQDVFAKATHSFAPNEQIMRFWCQVEDLYFDLKSGVK